jgi:hypothetical protein
MTCSAHAHTEQLTELSPCTENKHAHAHYATNITKLTVGKVLGGGECKTGCDNTLDGGVIGEVEEEAHVLHGAVLLEILLEKAGSLHVHTHSSENDSEVALSCVTGVALGILPNKTCLPADLCGDFIVGQTSSTEKGNLLAARNRVHGVDSGNTCRKVSRHVGESACSRIEWVLHPTRHTSITVFLWNQRNQ